MSNTDQDIIHDLGSESEASTEVHQDLDPEIEREAKDSGWVPKSEFRGDEKDWVDADTFVKRGREINPILRKNNERLRKELQDTRNELKEHQLSVAEFRKEFEDMKDKAYKRALNDLKAQRREALKEGDLELVDAIEEQVDEYKEQMAKKSAPPAPTPQKVDDTFFKEWHSDNSWYGSDKDLTREAELVGKEVQGAYPGLSGRAFLDEVASTLKFRYPEKFKNPRREQGSSVSSSGSRTESKSSTSKTKFTDLSKSEQAVVDRYVKQGYFKSREEYLSSIEE